MTKDYDDGFNAGIILGQTRMVKKTKPILSSLIAGYEKEKMKLNPMKDTARFNHLSGLIGLASEIVKILEEQVDS